MCSVAPPKQFAPPQSLGTSGNFNIPLAYSSNAAPTFDAATPPVIPKPVPPVTKPITPISLPPRPAPVRGGTGSIYRNPLMRVEY